MNDFKAMFPKGEITVISRTSKLRLVSLQFRVLRPKIIDTIVLKVYGKLLLLLLRENEEVCEMTLQALKFLFWEVM